MKLNLQPSVEDYRDDLRRQQARIQELERQLADLANGKLPEDSRLEPSLIETSAMVSSITREPMVMIRWFTHIAHLTIAQSRDLAFSLLDAGEAAQSDAFLLAFGHEKIGMPIEKAGALLMEFREFRGEMMKRQEQFEAEEREKETS